MKKALILAAALTALSAAQPAEARRGGGYAEGFLFVAEVAPSDASGAGMSLCILERTQKVAFIPIWRSAKSYVLAPGKCTGESYLEVTPAKFAEGQAAGYFPAHLPAEPKLTLAQQFEGGWGGLILLLGLLIEIAKSGFGSLRRKQPESFASRAIQVMCLVAKSDGQVSEREITVIKGIVKQLTDQDIPRNVIIDMVAAMPGQMTDREMKRLGKGLNQSHRDVLVQAAAMVAGGDGQLEGGESHAIYRLAKALKVDLTKADQMVDSSLQGSAVPAE